MKKKKPETKTKLNRISLVIGDWSHDGHEKTEDIDIRCNFTTKELHAAYKKGTEKLGFDFIATVAVEYEDDRLPADKWEKLTKLGLKLDYELEPFDDLDGEEDDYRIDSITYAEIIMFICSLGSPDLTYKFIEKDYSDNWHVGGYGLFC